MYRTFEDKMKLARQMIWEHENLVCILGVGMETEAGMPDLFGDEMAYVVEEKFDRSVEEILSAGYYNTRPQPFFECYKEFCLSYEHHKTEAYDAIRTLETWGKVKGTITQSIFSVAKEAGISNLIELHGSIYDNQCPKCKRMFSKEFIRGFKGVPVCPDCKMTIRPGIVLTGELVRNDYMTYAANLVSSADFLLVLGTNMNDNLVKWAMRYFEGDKVLVINENEHFSDNRANLVLNKPVREILPVLIKK